MTTNEYLSQISRTDHAIKNKLSEIKRLSDMATSISVSPKEVDVQSSGDQDKLGSAVAKIVDLQNEISVLVDGLVTKRREIIGQIDSMEDTDVYIVLAAHYIDGKDWNVISVDMDCSYRNAMKLRKKALREFETKFGALYLGDNTKVH